MERKKVLTMSLKITPSHSFWWNKMHICIFSCKTPDTPVVYLPDLEGYGRQVLPLLQSMQAPAFNLVTITIPYDLWSHVLAPWNTPENYPDYVACTGGAPEFLKGFVEEIIPECESKLKPVSYRAMAGYSLAGLFGIYAMCCTPMFERVMSASGSLWFPGFDQWFMEHLPLHLPESVYFSSSADEYNTTNKFLAPVKPITEQIREWLADHGVETTFTLNQGNHYQDVIPRTAAGIFWMLEHPKSE